MSTGLREQQSRLHSADQVNDFIVNCAPSAKLLECQSHAGKRLIGFLLGSCNPGIDPRRIFLADYVPPCLT
jgi:hypothetical protein